MVTNWCPIFSLQKQFDSPRKPAWIANKFYSPIRSVYGTKSVHLCKWCAVSVSLIQFVESIFFLVDNPTKLRLICTVFVCFRFHPAKIGAFLPFCGTSSNQTTSPSDVSMVRDAAIARITLDCANSSLMFALADSLFSWTTRYLVPRHPGFDCDK